MTASSELPRRRFIAGAVYLNAKLWIVWCWRLMSMTTSRHVTRCLRIQRNLQAKSTRNAPMPRARFERSKAQAVDVEPVKILDPSPPSYNP